MREQGREPVDGVATGPGGITRRRFIQDVVAVSAVTGAIGSVAVSSTGIPVAHSFAMLTPTQANLLSAVLNRLIPSEGVMPGAGTVGVARFIDQVLADAPHLRPHIVGLLSRLDVDGASSDSSEVELDAMLQRLEHEQKASFDILLETTYTGYYSEPQVVAALGGVPIDAPSIPFEPFDVSMLEDVVKRGPIYRQV